MWNYIHTAPWLIYDREFEDSERDRITHHKKTKQRAPTWRTSWTRRRLGKGARPGHGSPRGSSPIRGWAHGEIGGVRV